MSTPVSTRLQELRAEVRAALVAEAVSNADKVEITSDARDIDKAATQRYGIVIVRPFPEIEWPTRNVTRRTWYIDVIQKATDQLKALDRIDTIVEAIRRHIDISNAEPEDTSRVDGAVNPGYTLTLTEDHID